MIQLNDEKELISYMVWAVAAIHTTCSEKTADHFKNTLIDTRKKNIRSVKMLVECGTSLFESFDSVV